MKTVLARLNNLRREGVELARGAAARMNDGATPVAVRWTSGCQFSF